MQSKSRRRAPLARRSSSPLSGVRVLVGRARHQAGALSGELRKLGATVIEIPFIEIRNPRTFEPLDLALLNLATYDWLVLTSVNGVEAMWERLKKLRLDKTDFKHLRIAAIGPATKKAIEQRGVHVDVVPKEYVAESVVRSLHSRVKGKRVLLVRAKVARDVIPRELRKAGAQVDVVEAYETVIPSSSRTQLSKLFADPHRRPQIVTFTSSSTAKNFVALLGKQRPSFDNVLFASIGPVTSATLREIDLPVDIETREYTIPGLVGAIVARTSRRISSEDMRANLRMKKLLKGIKFPTKLNARLRASLNAGFMEKNGCVILASEARRSFGGDVTDRIGYECFVNHIHVPDFPQAWLYANELWKMLSLSRWGGCAVIISFNGKNATVRFHRIRPDQPWLAEDLEEYQEEAIAVLRSR